MRCQREEPVLAHGFFQTQAAESHRWQTRSPVYRRWSIFLETMRLVRMPCHRDLVADACYAPSVRQLCSTVISDAGGRVQFLLVRVQ